MVGWCMVGVVGGDAGSVGLWMVRCGSRTLRNCGSEIKPCASALICSLVSVALSSSVRWPCSLLGLPSPSDAACSSSSVMPPLSLVSKRS